MTDRKPRRHVEEHLPSIRIPGQLKRQLDDLAANDFADLCEGDGRLSHRICDTLGLDRNTEMAKVHKWLADQAKRGALTLYDVQGKEMKLLSPTEMKKVYAACRPGRFDHLPASVTSQLGNDRKAEILADRIGNVSWSDEEAEIRDRILYLVTLFPEGLVQKPKGYRDGCRGIMKMLFKLLNLPYTDKQRTRFVREVIGVMNLCDLIVAELTPTSTNPIKSNTELDLDTLERLRRDHDDVRLAYERLLMEARGEDPWRQLARFQEENAVLRAKLATLTDPATVETLDRLLRAITT